MGFTTLIIPTAILLAGVVNDLRSRKVKNTLVIVCAVVALGAHIYFDGLDGIKEGGLSFISAILLTLPLVLIRVLGAGDMKLLAAFALAVNWHAVLVTTLTSLVWGALLGIFKAILSGNGFTLLKNTGALIVGAKPQNLQTTQIPYTVALLFGWLTYISLEFHGAQL